MTAWVRADSEDPIRQVISHDNAGFDRSLGIDSRGGGNGWSAFSGTGGVLGFQSVIIGEWVFLAVVYDQVAGNIKLYVNDIMMEKQGMLNEGLNTLLIGSNPSFGEYFSGAIDEVRIYSRTLTTSEIQEIFNL
ncbi:MAG: LamG domain-containing protein [Gammaproteobacteria bacterium]|nr:LamG domain-containing protein [Gammaproteobacteria bacterium]MCF6261584.1 LamG domain-containing protein [Gammaproteobacteria bacterium]